ncbi:MAG: class II aldolase/adducin family protein, partial [Candidatus Omnitrophica bacterium]|nr:class II aldolase/adducin family protein [Candidatus Omnitrophota bacterium]
MNEQQKKIKEDIIKIGKILYEKNLAVAKSGNISSRLDSESILITATGTSLGYLEQADIVEFNLNTEKVKGDKVPTSELALHCLVYKNFSVKAIIHCHAPLINGYFAVASDLKALTFETKFYLGKVPIVKQDTPTVTKPQEVIEALKISNIVVLKNHGVVAVGNNFFEALNLIEALEEAIRTIAARLFKKDLLDELETELKSVLAKEDKN